MASIVTRKSIEVQIKEACERARKNPDLYIIAIGDTGCGWNAIVNSASTPFQEYTIVRDVDGNLHCSCPAQIVCKHVGLLVNRGVSYHSTAVRQQPAPDPDPAPICPTEEECDTAYAAAFAALPKTEQPPTHCARCGTPLGGPLGKTMDGGQDDLCDYCQESVDIANGRPSSRRPPAPATVKQCEMCEQEPATDFSDQPRCAACVRLCERMEARKLARQQQKSRRAEKRAGNKRDRRAGRRDLARYAGPIDELLLTDEQEDALAAWHAKYFPPAKPQVLCCFCREHLAEIATPAGIFCSAACIADYQQATRELLKSSMETRFQAFVPARIA